MHSGSDRQHSPILRGAFAVATAVVWLIFAVASPACADTGGGAPAVAGSALQDAARSSPDERLVAERCTLCHGVLKYMPLRHSLPGWLAVVWRMRIVNQAPLSAEESWRIARHLAGQFPAATDDALLEWGAALAAPAGLVVFVGSRLRRRKSR